MPDGESRYSLLATKNLITMATKKTTTQTEEPVVEQTGEDTTVQTEQPAEQPAEQATEQPVEEQAEEQPAPVECKIEVYTKIGQQLLERHPTVSEVYVTSDGYAFLSLNAAQNNARRLSGHKVFIVKR